MPPELTNSPRPDRTPGSSHAGTCPAVGKALFCMAMILASCTKTEETGIDAGPWDSAIPDACRDCDEDSGAGTDAAVDSGREGPDERPVCLFDYGPSVIVTKGRSKKWENFKEVFAYTRTGLVRSMEQFEEDNGEWKRVYSITFRYDPEGRLASSIEETLSGNLRTYGYEYDSESRLSVITWVEEYASAEKTGRLALTHDASGLVREARGCEYCSDAIREISIYRLCLYNTDDTVESTRFSECSSDCYQAVRNLAYHPDSLLDQVSGMCGYGYPVGEMTYFSEKYLWSDAGVLAGMLRDEALDCSPPSTLLPA